MSKLIRMVIGISLILPVIVLAETPEEKGLAIFSQHRSSLRLRS